MAKSTAKRDSNPNDDKNHTPQKGHRAKQHKGVQEETKEDQNNKNKQVKKHLSFNGPTEDSSTTSTEKSQKSNGEEKETADTTMTYADAAQKAPTPTPPTQYEMNQSDLPMTCRYIVCMILQPSDKPLEQFCTNFKKMFKALQERAGKNVHIGAWDEELAPQYPNLKKPADIPKGTDWATDHRLLSKYVHGYFSPQSTGGKIFMKMRFFNGNEKVLIDMFDLGETLQGAFASLDFQLTFPRNPISCQAVKVTCVGWLYGSTKTISDESFLPQIQQFLDIPLRCNIGLQWRAITDQNGKRPQYDRNNPTANPYALHLDVDDRYAPIVEKRASALWCKARKGNKRLPNDVQLRLIPCFTSAVTKGKNKEQKENILAMADKQHYLTLHVIKRFEVPFIRFLDKSLSPTNPITLRRAMMARATPEHPTHKILHNVDFAWNKTTTLAATATERDLADAVYYTHYLIPEMLHLYGDLAKMWFTTEGLTVYQDTTWDPEAQKSRSVRDAEQSQVFHEDLYGIGDSWKLTRDDQQGAIRPTPPGTDQEIQAADAARASKLTLPDDSDNRSFASVFGRPTPPEQLLEDQQRAEAQAAEATTKAGGRVQLDNNTLEVLAQAKEDGASQASGLTMSTVAQGTTQTTHDQLDAAIEQIEEKDAQIALLLEMLQAQGGQDEIVFNHEDPNHTALPTTVNTGVAPMDTEVTAESKRDSSIEANVGRDSNEDDTSDHDENLSHIDLDSFHDEEDDDNPMLTPPRRKDRSDRDSDTDMEEEDDESSTGTEELKKRLHYGLLKTRNKTYAKSQSGGNPTGPYHVTPQAHNLASNVDSQADGATGSVGQGV